jgi:type IV fimbrial biogenesis protein FimT
LVELAATVAIAAIVLAIAAPSFSTFVQNNSLLAGSNDVVLTLNAARSEAVKRRGTVTVCASSSGAACSNASNWESGWIAFLDQDSDRVVDGADGDEILLRQGAFSAGTIRTSGFAATSFVQYSAVGRASSAGFFNLCDSRGVSHARNIAVTVTGRISSEDVGSAQCP